MSSVIVEVEADDGTIGVGKTMQIIIVVNVSLGHPIKDLSSKFNSQTYNKLIEW